jgi:hypothetical protein
MITFFAWLGTISLDQYLVAFIGGNFLTLYLVIRIGAGLSKLTKKTKVDDEFFKVLGEVVDMARGGRGTKISQPKAAKEPIPLKNVMTSADPKPKKKRFGLF